MGLYAAKYSFIEIYRVQFWSGYQRTAKMRMRLGVVPDTQGIDEMFP
jgi:hypothetical protein